MVSIVLVEDVERKGEEGGLFILMERKFGLVCEGMWGECVIWRGNGWWGIVWRLGSS